MRKSKIFNELEKMRVKAQNQLNKSEGIVENCYNVGYLEALADVIIKLGVEKHGKRN